MESFDVANYYNNVSLNKTLLLDKNILESEYQEDQDTVNIVYINILHNNKF